MSLVSRPWKEPRRLSDGVFVTVYLGTRLMAKSSPYLGPKAIVLGISIAGYEGRFSPLVAKETCTVAVYTT